MKYLLLLCALSCSSFIACGSPRDEVVAEVGPQQIRASALRTFVEELPAGLQNKTAGDAARRQYLQSLIDRRLLLLEAHALGLDTTQALRRSVRGAVSGRVRTLYRKKEIMPQAKVAEEDVRRRFAEEGFDRERKLSAILVKSREEIEAVLAELAAGRSFAEVARTHSLDERSVAQGGELGFVGRDMLAQLHIPVDIFTSLPAGKISPPLRAGASWHVVRFTDERPTFYQDYRPRLEEKLFQERYARAEAEHLEVLMEDFEVHLNPPGLRAMVDAYQKKKVSPLRDDATPLYTHAQGAISVAQAQEVLQRHNISYGMADSTQAVSTLQHLVLTPFLLDQASRRAGLYDDPQVQRFQRAVRENALLEAVRKAAASGEEPSEAEVRAFYDSRPELFYHEKAVWLDELLLSSEAEARRIRQQLEKGAPFANFLSQSQRPGAARTKGRIHLHPREKVLYPNILPAAMQATRNELVGPIKTKDGQYSVFRVLFHEEAQVEPYEKVRRRARAMLRRQRENAAFDAFVKELRQKYAPQTRIYAERLKKALPDSLVRG